MAVKRLHFMGITGHTMRGLALAAVDMGYEVTGTDPGGKPPGSDWLDAKGITWWKESDPAHLKGVDMLILSGGTQLDDPELMAAQEQKLPILSYAEFVAQVVADKRQIVVAGTHGKTTTTSLITWLFEVAGHNPDYVIGITPNNFDTSVRLGDSKVVIIEGDEYKASSVDTRSKFAFYNPNVLVATSLEMDHPDIFKNINEIKDRFKDVIERMTKDSKIFVWADSPELKVVSKNAKATVKTYGQHGDWRSDHIQFTPHGISFDLYEGDVYRDHFRVGLYGRHNVDNATAAIAAALGEGLTTEQIQRGCDSFLGASRRFTIVSKPRAKVTVIDDYAHHPTEIAATIDAAHLHFSGRVLAVVRPHTYSRTAELLGEYRSALRTADRGFVTDIEAAREASVEQTVSGSDVAKDNGHHVLYEPDRSKLIDQLTELARPGDVILCMTVGGYEGLAEELASKLP